MKIAFCMWVTQCDEYLAPLAIRRLRKWHGEPVLVISERGVSYAVLEALSRLGCRNVLAASLKRDTEDFLFDRWQQVSDHFPECDAYIRIDPDTEVRGKLTPPAGEWFGPRCPGPDGWTVWGCIGGFSKEGLRKLLSVTRVGRTDTCVNSVGLELVSADLITTQYMSEPVDWPEVIAGSVFRPTMVEDKWQAVHPCLEKWIPQHLWHRMEICAELRSEVREELTHQLSSLSIKRPIREVPEVNLEFTEGNPGYENVLKVDADGSLVLNGVLLGNLFTDGLRAAWTSDGAIRWRKRLMSMGHLREHVT